MTPACDHNIPVCLREIDWLLRRLVRLRETYPGKVADINPRIDGCLDERLRLMRVRDLSHADQNQFRYSSLADSYQP